MEVEFNENKQTDYYNRPTKNSGITNMLIKIGLAKDEKNANTVMIVVIIICLAFSVYFLMK